MKKILFAAAEAVPFIKTGGLADVAGSLPFAFDPAEYDVRVMLPAYTCIPAQWRGSMRDLTHFYVWFNGKERYLGVRELTHRGLHFYFIDNEDYFGGPAPYTDYMYDIEKFCFFSFAVLAVLPHIDFQPEIIHCHDWHTGLIPPYLATQFRYDPFFAGMRTVFTIHNLKFQGICGRDELRNISGLPGELFAQGPLCSGSCGNMMQGALHYADAVTTVSQTYAKEICTPEYGEGLDRFFAERRDRFSGIVNGIDDAVFDPAKDPALRRHYDVSHVKSGKAASKAALQKELGLEQDPDAFLLGIVSRLTDQKGMDLVLPLLEKLTNGPCQLVVLGTGERHYEDSFRLMAGARPNKMSVVTTYDEPLSHRIYAGTDAFLMPSRFEPCGLSQLIALRYGSLPIVRATGGLRDTVRSLDKEGAATATGFVFEDYDVGGLNWAIELAMRTFFDDKKTWEQMRRNAMREDFSWSRSAEEYGKLYEEVMK